jgi:hypothetical protein
MVSTMDSAIMDMNGDGRTDLWVSRATGASGYFGSAKPGFVVPNSWTVPGLKLMEHVAF